jgi:hypothetical protein
LINADEVGPYLPTRLNDRDALRWGKLTLVTPGSDDPTLRSDVTDLSQFRGQHYFVISWDDGSRAAVWAPDLKVNWRTYIRAYEMARDFLETFSWVAGGPEPKHETHIPAADYARQAGGGA